MKTLWPKLLMIVGAALIGYGLGWQTYPLIFPLLYPVTLHRSDQYSDWVGHIIFVLDWPHFIASLAALIAGAGLLIAWFLWRKRA